MNRTAWKRILEKYPEEMGPGKKVIVILKTSRDHVAGTIKEIDEDFLVLATEDGPGVEAIIALEDVTGFRRS